MPNEANHSPHSAYVINNHLVWNPRYRKKVLVDPVEARLNQLLAEIAVQYELEIMAVEVTPALTAGASVPAPRAFVCERTSYIFSCGDRWIDQRDYIAQVEERF